MGMMSWDEVVLIEEGKSCGDPTVVTVNCPDKAGLGCDLLRILLGFGLYVTRGGHLLFKLNLASQFFILRFTIFIFDILYVRVC